MEFDGPAHEQVLVHLVFGIALDCFDRAHVGTVRRLIEPEALGTHPRVDPVLAADALVGTLLQAHSTLDAAVLVDALGHSVALLLTNATGIPLSVRGGCASLLQSDPADSHIPHKPHASLRPCEPPDVMGSGLGPTHAVVRATAHGCRRT